MAIWNKAREAHEKSLKQGGPKTTSFAPAVYPTADGATCRKCGYVVHAKTCPTLKPALPPAQYADDERQLFKPDPKPWPDGPPYAPWSGCGCREHFRVGEHVWPSCPMNFQTVMRVSKRVADGRVFGNTQWWVCDRAWESLHEEHQHNVRVGTGGDSMRMAHANKLTIATVLGQVMIARISDRQADADAQRRMMQPPHRQSGGDALITDTLESLIRELQRTVRDVVTCRERMIPCRELEERAGQLREAISAQAGWNTSAPWQPDIDALARGELRNGLGERYPGDASRPQPFNFPITVGIEHGQPGPSRGEAFCLPPAASWARWLADRAARLPFDASLSNEAHAASLARELDRNAGYQLAASDYKVRWPAQYTELRKQLTAGQIGHFVSNPMNKTRAEQCMRRMCVPVQAGGKDGCVFAANDAGSISVWDSVTKTWNTSAAWPQLESAVSYKLCDWPEGSRPR